MPTGKPVTASLVNDARSVEQLLLAVDNRIMLPLDERQSVALNLVQRST